VSTVQADPAADAKGEVAPPEKAEPRQTLPAVQAAEPREGGAGTGMYTDLHKLRRLTAGRAAQPGKCRHLTIYGLVSHLIARSCALVRPRNCRLFHMRANIKTEVGRGLLILSRRRLLAGVRTL
jgi:hypothetical protein